MAATPFPSRLRDHTERDDSPLDLDPPDELRPIDDPTIRERLDDLVETIRGGPLRLIGPILALALLAGAGWWLLRPPDAPPIEAALPLATDGATSPADGAVPASASASASASGPDPTPSDPAGATGADPAASTGSDAGAGEEPTEVVIAIAGAVHAPGVHRLPAGARVDDAVRIAGGMTADADGDRLNLAAPLTDGERIWVPRIGEEDPPDLVNSSPGSASGSASASAGGAASGSGPSAPADAPVNLNTAGPGELENLPGVGPATAAAIIAHREANGAFATVDQLIDVRGIGEVKLEHIRPHATV